MLASSGRYGQTKAESTVRYVGLEADVSLEITQKIDI
jgi:hypothetical protein